MFGRIFIIKRRRAQFKKYAFYLRTSQTKAYFLLIAAGASPDLELAVAHEQNAFLGHRPLALVANNRLHNIASDKNHLIFLLFKSY